jgi:hypothetical protein
LNKTRSAIRAGYAKRNATSTGYKLFQNPAVKKAIERLSGTYVSERVDSLFSRYVESLEQRAFYDVADFYDGEQLKSLSEIEERKRIAIDGIDYKEKKRIYMFGDRKIALREIRELHAKQHPDWVGGMDAEEETREIIMERIEVRQKRRASRDYAELEREIVDRPCEEVS